MPRFSRLGSFCSGVAGGIIAIDRKPIGRGGGTRWLTDDTVLANSTVAADQYHLFSFTAPDWTPVLVDPRGASAIGAGDRSWAATLQTRPPQSYGIYRCQLLPPPLSTHAVLDGDGGILAFVDTNDYASFTVLWPNGERTSFRMADVNLGSVRACASAAGVCFCAGPQTAPFFYSRTEGIKPLALAETPVFFPFVYTEAGLVYALYWTAHYGLVLQYLSAPAGRHGWQWPGDTFYGPDVHPATRQIVYALNAAESPDALRVIIATGDPQPLHPIQ